MVIFIYMSRHVMVRESLRDITAHIWRFIPIYTNFFAPSPRQKTPLDTLPPGFLVTNWAKSGKVWFCLSLTLKPRLNQACKVYALVFLIINPKWVILPKSVYIQIGILLIKFSLNLCNKLFWIWKDFRNESDD